MRIPSVLICALAVLAVSSLLIGAVPAVGQGPTATADFYVAPDGDDTGPGSFERPFATLARARDAVRDIIAAGLERDVTVLIRGGTYRLGETLVFGLADSGTDEHGIAYAAYPGETPVFSPGLPIRAWRRLEEELPGLPSAAQGEVWVADVPTELSRFRTLHDGVKRLPRARSRGFQPAVKYPRSPRPADWSHRLEFPAGTLRAWPHLDDVEVVVVPQYPWSSNILPLDSVDIEAGVARTAVPSTYPMGQVYFGHFPEGTAWVENVPEALDEPGEWMLDPHRRKLYFWPPGGEPGESIVAPRLTELLRVEGRIDYDGPTDRPVRNLTFRGLTFTQGDRWPWEPDHVGWGLQHDWEMFDRPTALVRFRGAEGCSVESCRFANSGGAALRLDLQCRENGICGNTIEHVGGVGVLLAGYGPGTKDVNRRNEVTGNRIHHVGELLWHSPGIFVWQSGENRIAHNLIHHTPYTAIVVSGRIHWRPDGEGQCSKTIRWAEIARAAPDLPDRPTWHDREPFLHGRNNRVELNEIHHVMEVLGDGNGIYISGTGGGNVVRRNYLHDADSPNINANIRCDDDQHETVIEENVIFYSCGEGFISKGNNTIRNNIVANLRPTTTGGLPCGHTRGYLVLPYGDVSGSRIERNIFYSRVAGQNLLYEGGRGRNPKMSLRACRADYNVYFCEADSEWGSRHLAEQRPHGVEMHSIAADPLFVDVDRGDLRLREGSPALKLGIRAIDLTGVGPNDDRSNQEKE